MRGVHALAFCALASIGSAANAQEIDWKKVDGAIGRSAAAVAGDVHRYAFPRSDLSVTNQVFSPAERCLLAWSRGSRARLPI
jgi:hypothetical protein